MNVYVQNLNLNLNLNLIIIYNICNILHTILKKYFTFFSMIFLPCKQTIFLCKHLRYNLANRILTCQKDLSRK